MLKKGPQECESIYDVSNVDKYNIVHYELSDYKYIMSIYFHTVKL